MWVVPVEVLPRKDLLKDKAKVPEKRLINAEYISRMDLTYNTIDDTYTLEIQLINTPPVSMRFSTRSEAMDALELWSSRVEHAGTTKQQ
jgi:hypothetical protein